MPGAIVAFAGGRWMGIALRALGCSLTAVAGSVIVVGAVFAIFELGSRREVSHTSITQCSVTGAGPAFLLSWTMPATGEAWRHRLWWCDPGESQIPMPIMWRRGEPSCVAYDRIRDRLYVGCWDGAVYSADRQQSPRAPHFVGRHASAHCSNRRRSLPAAWPVLPPHPSVCGMV